MKKLLMKAVLHVTLPICLFLQTVHAVAEEPRELYRKSIGGVVWIENFVQDGSVTGSGFLADQQRKLVVTNYHVTDGEETMDVYFPVRDADGDLIVQRDYYRKNRAQLKSTGHYTPGPVVAYAPGKDLAIVAVSSLPASAVELETASDEPSSDDRLYLLGNPGGRDLWQLAAGVKPSIKNFRGKYRDYPVAMDYKKLSYTVNNYFGNSGGPVLNADGKVVGVHSSGGGEGDFLGGAIHWSEVDELLESIDRHEVVSIENASSMTLPYQIRWGDGDWDDSTVGPHSSMVHWLRSSKGVRPEIRFDCSAAPGYQEKLYTLDYYISHLGRNVKPSLERDAMEYVFRYDRTGQNLDLYKK